MPVRQGAYNPTQSNELLKLLMMEKAANAAPGQVPSGIAANAYFGSLPNSNEQEREAGVLDDAAARATALQNAESQARQQEEPLFKRAEDEAFQRKLQLAGEPARVAGSYGVKAAESKAAAQADALNQLLGLAGTADRGVTVSGVGSVSAPKPAPSSVAGQSALDRMLQTREAAAKKTPTEGGFAGFGTHPSQAAVDATTLRNARGLATQLIQANPTASVDELVQMANQAEPDLNPDERSAVYTAISLLRGGR